MKINFVFGNEALMRISGLKRGKYNRDWQQQYNRELHALYLSPDIPIVRIMKLKRLCWAEHMNKWENLEQLSIT